MNARTKGGIYVHLKVGDSSVHPNVYGEVLEVGDAVDEVEPGDLVLFTRYAGIATDGSKFGYPDEPGEKRKTYYVIDVEDIESKVEISEDGANG